MMMMARLLAVLVLVTACLVVGCSAYSSDVPSSGSIPPNTTTFQATDDLIISYNVTSDEVSFTLAATGVQGWVALGFNSVGHMKGMNCFVFYIINDNFYAWNAQATGHSQPASVESLGDTSDIKTASGSYKDGVFYVDFSVPIGGVGGDSINFANTSGIYFLFAYNPHASGVTPATNPADYATIQQHYVHGYRFVSITKGGSSNMKVAYVGIIRAHGILMITAWVVLTTWGIFIARFLKNRLGHLWYQLHQTSQLLTIFVTIAGFTCVVVYDQGLQFNDQPVHFYFGYGIVLLMVVQAGLGYAANALWYPNKKPGFVDKSHWVVGWTLHAIGVTNCILGVDLLASENSKAFYFIMGEILAIFGIYLFLFMYAELYVRTEKVSLHDDVDEDAAERKFLNKKPSTSNGRVVDMRLVIFAFVLQFGIFADIVVGVLMMDNITP